MEIKRVLAGGMAALAAGATLAFGAAATTLGDFVTVSGNSMTSPYIVIGGNAAAEDTLAAADVGVALAGQATTPATIPGASTVSATGGVMINSDLNKTYKGQSISVVKSSITNTDLPTLLETLSFTDLNASTISYTQRLTLGDVSATFGKPSGETDPVLYMNLPTSSSPFNFTVNFIGGLDPSAVDTSYKLKLFGKEFTFGPTHTNQTLDLYSTVGASTVTLSGIGDEEVVNVEGTDYTFKVTAYSGSTGVALTVNDQATSPVVWSQGGTYPLPDGSGIKVYVNSVSVLNLGAQETTVTAQLFVGTDKLRLRYDGSAVSKNDASTNSLSYFSAPGSKINSIEVEVYPQEDTVVKEGQTFTDPIFGAVKMSLEDMTPALTGSSRDHVKLTGSSTQAKFTFTNKDGNTYTDIPFAFGNSTSTVNRKKDATYDFYTTECNGSYDERLLTKGDYFVTTSGDYSYVFKYENYYIDSSDSTKNYVILTDLSTTTQHKVYLDTSDNYLRIGSLSFKVYWNSSMRDAKKLCVDLNGDDSFTEASVTVKTQSGQILTIPQDTPSQIVLTETPLYTVTGSNDPTRTMFNSTINYSSTYGMTFTPLPAIEQVGSEYEWKYLSNLGTYVHSTGDSQGKKIVNYYFPGQRPAYVNLAIGSDPVISTSTSAGGTIQEAVQIQNSISKMESEIDTSAVTRDLVLLGGPCANSLVAELLNMSASNPDCATEFTALYPTEGVITVVDDAFGSGKMALIVAGVNRASTRDLAVKVMQGTTEYEA